MKDLINKLKEFAAERDWDQFHSPKNLTMALSVEVGEIVEHFQWLTEEESYQLNSQKIGKNKRRNRRCYNLFSYASLINLELIQFKRQRIKLKKIVRIIQQI